MALSTWLLHGFLVVLSFQTDCMKNSESVSSTFYFPRTPSLRDWLCSRCFQGPAHTPWTFHWPPSNLQWPEYAFLCLKDLSPSPSIGESLLFMYMEGQSVKKWSPSSSIPQTFDSWKWVYEHLSILTPWHVSKPCVLYHFPEFPQELGSGGPQKYLPK